MTSGVRTGAVLPFVDTNVLLYLLSADAAKATTGSSVVIRNPFAAS